MEKIDINFDFTTDTPKFWDNFWQDSDRLGLIKIDPDAESPTLRKYHRILWSKLLPNGEIMELNEGSNNYNYLYWKNFRFGSDSIITGFRYKKLKKVLEEIRLLKPDYEKFQENFIRHTYTIGGMIIFPKMKNSINQIRGTNSRIRDRIDLTLECIRKYYSNEKSPLFDTLKNNSNFFDLFIDFKGYVDFFFLQDLVASDYKSIKFMLGVGNFDDNPLPCTVEDWFKWYDNSLRFIELRNKRIAERTF